MENRPYPGSWRFSTDDRVSMLAMSDAPSSYRAFQPNSRRRSSVSSTHSHKSWIVSPTLQHALPPLATSSPHIGASIFAPSPALDGPWQEPIWPQPVSMSDSPQTRPLNGGTSQLDDPAEVTESPKGRRYFRHPRHILEPWKPGFWTRFPWWGFSALFLVILLTGLSAGILLASNGRAISSWRIGDDDAQVQVYISTIEIIINFLSFFALAEGIVIRFWRQLLRGTTLSAINDAYESSFFWLAFKRLIQFRFNMIAIACLVTAATFARGPLFQRAIVINTSVVDSDAFIELKVAPVPIAEYFQSASTGGITAEFAGMLQGVSVNTPLAYNRKISGCGDYCIGKLKGFAFKADCSSSTQPLSLNAIPEECKSCSTADCRVDCAIRAGSEPKQTFFSLGYQAPTTPNADSQDNTLTIQSIFKKEASCKSELQVRTCSLTQVTTDYNITIRNGTIDRLPTEPNAMIYNDAILVDKLLMEKYWPLAFAVLFPPISVDVNPARDYSHLQYTKCVNHTTRIEESTPLCTNGTIFETELLTNDPGTLYATPSTSSSNQDLCSLTWRDPMQDVLEKMQTLAFRITVDMAQSSGSVFAPKYTGAALDDLRKSWRQSIRVSSSARQAIYKINRIFVVVGIVLSILGVVAIFPLYIGFWELGRRVSLNPLEVARAFGARMMDGLDGNATPEVITLERGGMAVRYGALERFGDEKKLRVEETSRATVRQPWDGEIFG